jgi:hypothetical protein
MVYSTNIRLSPVLVFKRLMESAAATGFSGFILSLPPMLLFLAAKIILPKRYLVSVISGGMKS